ncbi:pentatricopeptide repeat-containing protein At1g08070, chloroplastic [Aristolochia californica]|uniref:pentatricopeptide repeat-containing protein At1g08070, chloroplastic n=1 Tax=Aristolochia californica TaxID=171875 RepID=UPI0035D81C68
MAFSSSSLVISWNPPYKLIQSHPSVCLLSSCKSIDTLKQIHSQIVKAGLHHTQFALSKLIEFCAVSPSGDLNYALLIFSSIDQPNAIIWNTIIRGHALGPAPMLAFSFYIQMLLSGVQPNSHTFPSLLKSCTKTSGTPEGKQIHAHVLKLGLQSNAYVHTSLINMYARHGELGYAHQVFERSCLRDPVSFTVLVTGYASRGHLQEARRLFDEMPVKDVVAWNAMISGYAQSGLFVDSLRFFAVMLRAKVKPNESTMVSVLSACAQLGCIELGNCLRSWIMSQGLHSNLRLTNALIDMYSKCGVLETARSLFDSISLRDQISWNVMIGGYTHTNHHKEALALFRQMQLSDVEPNEVTCLNVLPAVAYSGALDLGKWIHIYVDRSICQSNSCGDPTSVALYTSLIHMYAKCGSIESAEQVFDAIKVKSLSCWNAMISGLAMHGYADAALRLFSTMCDVGISPDDITFVGILSACSHAGLVESGRQYFYSMIQDYKIEPKVEHYGCMIDLLGRAGLFDEAHDLIQRMEMKPDGAIWGSLLGACQVHGNVELAELVASHLLELEPENPGVYALLSNIYGRAGRWEDVARVRTHLNDKGMKKEPGCTSIEVDNVIHEFLVGDKAHPRSGEVYKMLDEIDELLESAGFLPDTSQVVYDVNEEWKEGQLYHHSERLAIAYGLISTRAGSTIRIVKNLRVCRNCHTASKLISKIFNREIIARDRNRFHHFKDGECSCKDYW